MRCHIDADVQVLQPTVDGIKKASIRRHMSRQLCIAVPVHGPMTLFDDCGQHYLPLPRPYPLPRYP